MRYAMILIVLLLPACGPSREAALASDDQSCRSYGYKPGSQPYADCRMALDTRREDQRAAKAQAVSQSLRDMGQSVKPNKMEPRPILVQPPTPPKQTTCRTSRHLNDLITTCN